MKIAIAQLNPTVGDVSGNIRKLRDTIDGITVNSVDLAVFPELYLCGYPPRDMLNLPWFIDRIENALHSVVKISSTRPDLGILVGTVRHTSIDNRQSTIDNLYNTAILIEGGRILFEQRKQLLPFYDVFDEKRYFTSGERGDVFEYRGEKLGISICEDAWNDPQFEELLHYDRNPIAQLAESGASLLINISASPYHLHKELNRYERYAHHARRWGVPMVFIGQVGASDDLIFDGRSMVFDAKGRRIALLKAYEEEVRIVDTGIAGTNEEYPSIPDMESLRQALALGIKDYMTKTGIRNAFIGLSGGIDSALTACLAVDAIGSDNVSAVTMPSEYSSPGSVADSLKLSENLNIRCDVISITSILAQYKTTLADPFKGKVTDITEENLQARIRGDILMAYSNKFGGIVLNTGNKSETAVGYCTLYGDMCGGLAVISDLPKMMVYELACWYNRDSEIIPEAILNKPPSAELKPGQHDQDTLPPYEILDGILDRFLERHESIEEIVEAGFERDTVEWVVEAVNRSEYKRRQAAPGLRVTTRAFGTGWRMPIAARRSKEIAKN